MSSKPQLREDHVCLKNLYPLFDQVETVFRIHELMIHQFSKNRALEFDVDPELYDIQDGIMEAVRASMADTGFVYSGKSGKQSAYELYLDSLITATEE